MDRDIALQLVQNLDHVYQLNMMDAVDKADSAFEQENGVVGFDSSEGWAVFDQHDFQLEPGSYWIFVELASEESRPLRFLVDDQVIATNLCENATTPTYESYDLTWFSYGPYELHHQSGDGRSIRFDTNNDGDWPHVKRFVLVPAPTQDDASDEHVAVDQEQHDEPEIVYVPNVDHGYAFVDTGATPAPGTQIAVFTEPTETFGEINMEDGMIVVESDDGWYSFSFENPSRGPTACYQAYLDITYCSGEERPVRLDINDGTAFLEDVCSDNTGDFTTDYNVEQRFGPIPIDGSGTTTVKVTAMGQFFPHISQVKVIRA